MTICNTLSDTSTAVLRYREEKCWGDEAAGAMKALRMTGDSLAFEISTTVSNEIDPAAQRSDLVQTNAQASGGFEHELSYGTFDDLMQAQMRSTWTRPGPRVVGATDISFTAGATVGSVGSDLSVFAPGAHVIIRGAKNKENNIAEAKVTASTATSLTLDTAALVTEAAGEEIQIHQAYLQEADFAATATNSIESTAADLSLIPVGTLIRTSGYATDANNGLFTVSAAAAGAITTVETSLATEAGPATVKIEHIGVRGGGIEAVAIGNKLVSDGVIDWTEHGLAIGQFVRISGFATAGNNGFARIAAEPTATDLALDAITLTEENALGAATITVQFSDMLRNGIERRSFVMEREIRDKGYFWTWSGMVPNSMSLNIGTGEIMSGGFEFLGKSEKTVGEASTGVGDPLNAPTEPVINAVANVAKVIEAGTASTVYFSELSIEATNNLRAQNAIGSLGAVGIGYGVSEVTGSLTAFFSNPTFYNKFINNTETSVAFCINDNRENGYVFFMPRVKFSSGTAQASGVGEDFTTSMDYQALKSTDGTETTLQISRFPTISE